MSEPIPVPAAATTMLRNAIKAQQAADKELQFAIALVLATLGAPDGWQLRIEPDGSMVAVAPGSASSPTGAAE